jgi:hypothetical protein
VSVPGTAHRLGQPGARDDSGSEDRAPARR